MCQRAELVQHPWYFAPWRAWFAYGKPKEGRNRGSAREIIPPGESKWNVLFVVGYPIVLRISPSLRKWVGWVKAPCHMQEVSHMRSKWWTKVAHKDHEQKQIEEKESERWGEGGDEGHALWAPGWASQGPCRALHSCRSQPATKTEVPSLQDKHETSLR